MIEQGRVTYQRLAHGSVGWMQLSLGLKLTIWGLWWVLCFVIGFMVGRLI